METLSDDGTKFPAQLPLGGFCYSGFAVPTLRPPSGPKRPGAWSSQSTNNTNALRGKCRDAVLIARGRVNAVPNILPRLWTRTPPVASNPWGDPLLPPRYRTTEMALVA